jgi:hypothetical protein
MNVSVEWGVEDDDDSGMTSMKWYVGKVTKVDKKRNRMYVTYAADSSRHWHEMTDTDWRNLDEEEEEDGVFLLDVGLGLENKVSRFDIHV